MPAQDDVRERQLIDRFNLERPTDRVRHGTDAVLTLDDVTYEFELKSITTHRGGLGTVRDLGPDHIQKWRNKHWIVAYYQNDELAHCKYLTPDDMAPWIEEKWRYIESDFKIAEMVPATVTLTEMQGIVGIKSSYTLEDARRLHKMQLSAAAYRDMMDIKNGYSPARMLDIFRLRVRYVLSRGATLNNPKVPSTYLARFPNIVSDHAATLRAAIREWNSSKQARA